MKVTLFLTTLFINLSPLALAMESSPEAPDNLVIALGLPQASQEINKNALIISEKLISAHEKMETRSSFYGKERVDTWESKNLRENARALITSLTEMVENLVLIDAATLAKNLWMLPRGVVIEKDTGKITEPMTTFYKFTSLGACSLILNSLRDEEHGNFSRYNKSEKIDITKTIQNYSAQMARVGSQFIQHSYSSQGFLFNEAHSVNQLASSLIKEWSKG
jgi:hypothetical protein